MLDIRNMSFWERAHNTDWFTEDSRTSETIYSDTMRTIIYWKDCGEEVSCTSCVWEAVHWLCMGVYMSKQVVISLCALYTTEGKAEKK